MAFQTLQTVHGKEYNTHYLVVSIRNFFPFIVLPPSREEIKWFLVIEKKNFNLEFLEHVIK